jgi:hypothetical protein
MSAGHPLATPGAGIAPRPPEVVMRLARMGAAHPTRLSFLRVMLRRMEQEGWEFDRSVWEIDNSGVGRAVYRAIGPERCYSLVAFAHDLPEGMRSDRVIATAWDATFALFDGTPTPADLDRLQANVPLQEAGRISPRELSLSRANRSVRLWAHVVESLAEGRQPDADAIAAVGYLMRTTAVYGSGKFGAADRRDIAARPELAGPFQAEMLSVWLIRQFTVDIVEHLAAAKGGAAAVRLAPAIKHSLGVGNSTGLGVAPFLVRHPKLLHNWMTAREEALARVRAVGGATRRAVAALRATHAEACRNADDWRSEDPVQAARLAALRADLHRIGTRLEAFPGDDARPWDALWLWGERELSLEGQEQLFALLIEPHGDLVDGLADRMSAEEPVAARIDGAMPLGRLREILRDRYGWALAIDFTRPPNVARFWATGPARPAPNASSPCASPGWRRNWTPRWRTGTRARPSPPSCCATPGTASWCGAPRSPRATPMPRCATT